jgi:hypothetical protein
LSVAHVHTAGAPDRRGMAAVSPKKMNAIEAIDELVREYLVFRGCLGAARALEVEVKADRDRGFQAERLVEQLFASVSAYDLPAVTDLWAHLDTRFFSRLEDPHLRTVKRLELCLLRYYLVNAAQHGRRDKIVEFFDTLGSDAVDSDDWAPWFCKTRAPPPPPPPQRVDKAALSALHLALTVLRGGWASAAVCTQARDRSLL